MPRRGADARPGQGGKGKDDDAPTSRRAAADGDDDTILVAVPERSFSYEGRERVFYRTRDGDSLDEIADAFGVRSEELCEWNNLDPGAKLHPRMVVADLRAQGLRPRRRHAAGSGARCGSVTLGSEEFLELETARRGKKRLYYTAKAGDTLAKLGRRYGLTPGDLARINRFSYNTELHEGDRVVVYSPTGDAPRETTMGLTPGQEAPRARRRAAPRPRAAEAGGEEQAARRTVAQADVEDRRRSRRSKPARRSRTRPPSRDEAPTRPAPRRSSAAARVAGDGARAASRRTRPGSASITRGGGGARR